VITYYLLITFIQVLEDNLVYINCWEDQVENKKITNDEYLTQNTADGLRVTIQSTIELSKYLLDKCRFKFVLTNKMNQDRLEVYYLWSINDILLIIFLQG
jgi:hypothetical protein